MRIHVDPRGVGVGNQIFRFMFAAHLCARIPGSCITGYKMPEFGLDDAELPASDLLSIGPLHVIDVEALIKSAVAGGYPGILVDCWAQRLEYFEHDRLFFEGLFRSNVSGFPTGDDELVINVRAGEILRAVHPDYSPLPISFYRELISQSGLSPVFVGQIDDPLYGAALRSAFPEARFLKGAHWIEDFQTVRHATNIVTAISTFSWLAAWLSMSARRIILPIAGFLDPRQRPDVHLYPRSDCRYEFREIPVGKFVASKEQMEQLLA